MTGKLRKMKNPGEIDCWLEIIGYYRKNIAYDETCLFRAIAEQIYCSQMLHERVRNECLDYGRKHPQEFENFFGGSRRRWREHINKLSVHMVICENVELQLISKTYKRDILIFDGINFEIKNATKNNYEDVFHVCLVTKDHYDAIYKREYIVTAGFCQSIVYGILYENVFGVENVKGIVKAMLYGKPSPITSTESDVKSSSSLVDFVINLNENEKEEESSPYSPFIFCGGLAPFPYKVAKALDPNIYRNIAYDSWAEMRREMRLGEWYQGDDKLILGTCCELKTGDSVVRCYIQEFVKGNEQCVVYIPSTAERRTVRYTDLSPETNAKPWPLPYRFSKNTAPAITTPILTLPKNYRKNKDKKHKHESVQDTEFTEREINAFAGCPLHMKQADAAHPEKKSQEYVSTVCRDVSVTPKPATPSAVGTPQVFTSSDINMSSPFSYYPTSPFSFEVYTPQTEYMASSPSTPSPDNHHLLSFETTPPPPLFYMETPPVEPPPGFPMAPPPPPPLDIYPVYPMPGTPIIYSPPDAPDIILPPPPQPHIPVYTPAPVDMQYLPPSPFLYPPTPPPWYSPGVNPQGFIFPRTYNSHNAF